MDGHMEDGVRGGWPDSAVLIMSPPSSHPRGLGVALHGWVKGDGRKEEERGKGLWCMAGGVEEGTVI